MKRVTKMMVSRRLSLRSRHRARTVMLTTKMMLSIKKRKWAKSSKLLEESYSFKLLADKIINFLHKK